MHNMTLNGDMLKNIFDAGSHLATLLGSATWFIKLMYSIFIIVSIIALIVNISKLAMSGGNPIVRKEAIHNILIAGICLAVLGGLGLVFFMLAIII